MMKKIICLLIVLTLCLSVTPVLASEEASSLMDQVQEMLDAGDYDTAIPILQEAVEEGDAAAQNKLGYCYEEGLGVDQDYDEAVKYYRLAADQGFAKGQYNLGLCYLEGTGVEQDYEKAVEYYQLAADQGFAAAQLNLGLCYANGLGEEQDYEEAVKYFQLAADQEMAEAQYNLGVSYFEGIGVDQDYEEAVKYWQLAADQEMAEAQFSLGVCYQNGFGVDQDYEKAVEYYQLAADQGFAAAQFNLGYMYYFGEGVEQDYEEAMKYFNLAVEQEIPNAMFMLGVCYQDGTGVEKDVEKAAEWYEKAFTAGYEPDEEDEARLEEVLGEGHEEETSGEVSQEQIEKNIIGRWIKSEVDGQPVLTDEKSVYNIVSTTEAYSSASHITDDGTPFDYNLKSVVDIDGNVVTITMTNPEGELIVNEFTINSINENRFTANQKFTRTLEGADPLIKEDTVTFIKVNDDLSDDIIGTWEGHCTSEGSVFDDDRDHRWEYKDDGTYVYYAKDGDDWVPSEDTMNEYFVAGNLLCMRWMENGQENREWWEITIDGDSMSWTALREDEDGETFTAEFEMERVVE